MRRAWLPLFVVAAIAVWWWSMCEPTSLPAPSDPTGGAAAPATPERGALADGALPVGSDVAPDAAVAVRVASTPGNAPADARTTVRVIVVDDAQQPVEGATVRSVAGPSAPVATTDQDGAADVVVPKVGDTMHLRVESGPRHHQAHWQRSPEVTIRLPYAGPLRGRVVDAVSGTAVAGVGVSRGHNYCKGCEPDRAVTDVAGAFLLPAVPRAQDCTFVFTAPDYPRQHERLRLTGRGDEVEHTFRLARGVVFTGRCVDSTTRRPIAGAVLRLGGAELTTTAADGAFRVLVLPDATGVIQPQFTASGHCRTTFAVRTPQSDPAVEYPLPRVAAISGRVQASDGASIANARVRALGPEGPVASPSLPAGTRVEDEDYNLLAVTAPDGSFRLSGLVPGGTYRVRVVHDDFALPQDARFGVRVEVRDDLPPVVVVLAPKPRVDGFGTVVGTYRYNGVLAVARIQWQASGRGGHANTDAAGAFRLERAPAGRVEVTAKPQPFEHAFGELDQALTWRGHVDVPVDGEARLDIAQVVEEGTITGRVRLTDGAPAVQREVHAHAQAMRGRARTDERGEFTLRLPRLAPTWSVSTAGSANVEAALGAAGLELVVIPSHALRIAIRDEAGALVSAELVIRRPGEVWLQRDLTAPDPQGYRELSCPPGEYTLLAAAAGHAPVLRSVHVRDRTTVDLVLPRGTAVTVRLHAAADAPEPPVHFEFVDAVLAEIPPDNRRFVFLPGRGQLHLDRAGTVVRGVAPGTHRLIADGDVTLSPDTVVVGTEPVTVDVTWTRRAK